MYSIDAVIVIAVCKASRWPTRNRKKEIWYRIYREQHIHVLVDSSHRESERKEREKER